MKISKIISGGQTGADRGGLDAAIEYGLNYGGYIPKDRKAEDGRIPDIYQNLEELPTDDYNKRTELNILSSDCTIIFAKTPLTGGSKLTESYCKTHVKPYVIIDPYFRIFENSQTIINFLELFFPRELTLFEDDNTRIINVAGSRNSKCPNIDKVVRTTMLLVLNHINGSKESKSTGIAIGTKLNYCHTYQPEDVTIRKDAVYNAENALKKGLEYAKDALTNHDTSVGRTTYKNKAWAELMEKDIKFMEDTLKFLDVELRKFFKQPLKEEQDVQIFST